MKIRPYKRMKTLLSKLNWAAYRGRILRLVRFLSGWAWKRETDLAESVAILKELHATPGAMEITVKQRPELAQWVGQCFAEMVASSPNYTEMRFETRKPESWEWITVTVQKGTGKTPHTLRMDAEKERDELRTILESDSVLVLGEWISVWVRSCKRRKSFQNWV